MRIAPPVMRTLSTVVGASAIATPGRGRTVAGSPARSPRSAASSRPSSVKGRMLSRAASAMTLPLPYTTTTGGRTARQPGPTNPPVSSARATTDDAGAATGDRMAAEAGPAATSVARSTAATMVVIRE